MADFPKKTLADWEKLAAKELRDKALPSLDPSLQGPLAYALAARRRSGSDWRTWNWSRHEAQAKLKTVVPP